MNIDIDALVEELKDSRKEIKNIMLDAETLSGNCNDAMENIDRIIEMLKDNQFSIEGEDDQNETGTQNDTENKE